jgi:hypothetical protein
MDEDTHTRNVIGDVRINLDHLLSPRLGGLVFLPLLAEIRPTPVFKRSSLPHPAHVWNISKTRCLAASATMARSISGLPLEIRQMIWQFSLEDPRLIELRVKNSSLRQTSESLSNPTFYFCFHAYYSDRPIITTIPSPVPTILHICRESRQYGLGVYHKFSLGGYFNFNIDTLLISPDIFQPFKPFIRWPPGIPGPTDCPLLSGFDSKSLQRVAFYFPEDPFGPRLPSLPRLLEHMASPWTGLTTITLLSDSPRVPEFSANFESVNFESPVLQQVEFQFMVSPSLRNQQRTPRCIHGNLLYVCEDCDNRNLEYIIMRRGLPYITPFFYLTPGGSLSRYPKFF